MKTGSFLLYEEHGFEQAPYEEITEAQYLELSAKAIPITSVIDHQLYELADSAECGTGGCPIR